MAERKFYKDKPGPGYVLEQGQGWYLPEGTTAPNDIVLTPEVKAREKATKEKLGAGTPMPKQSDYPDIKDFAAAMRVWREQNRSAKDAAGALASRPKK